MTETILQTKLFIPPLRSNIVSRPHLIKQLNQGLQQGSKLILVSAPAGFGKTTLITDWGLRIAEPDPKSEIPNPKLCWLSLDKGDNDLTRFLTHLVALLQTIDSQIGRGLLAVLQSPEAVNVEAVLTTLLNEVDEFPDAVVLILDDYHVIESPPVDQAVIFLLDHLPPQVHLVIASRIDPSLPLSRLRAGGLMAELRAQDLRFTAEEAAVFLNKVMGLSLSVSDIVALETHTEGWIAGLQLAALSLQGLEGNKEIADFVSRFTGSDRYIQDYLADEVLQQRPQGTRDFLLQTSILGRLSAPLCDAVRFGETSAAENSSQEILESLETANLFIIPLDNERRWFRYHHLFADLLTHRLHQTFPDRIPNLHRRACLWYENEGYLDEAIHHAQAAGDTERMAEIIEEHWQEIIHRGEAVKLGSWLEALGPEYTRRSAPLSMAYCWIHVLKGRIDLIPGHLDDVKESLKEIPQDAGFQQPMRYAVIPSLVETMAAAVSLANKQARKAKAHAQKAISLIPNGSNPDVQLLLQGAAAYRLAEAHRELGEYDEACAILLAGLEMLKASENYFGAAATLLRIVAMYQKSGRTIEAIRLCEETLDYIEEHHWHEMAPSGLVHVMLAELQADSGAYTEARNNLELGLGLAEQLDSLEVHSLVQRVGKKLADNTPPSQPLIEPLSPRELEVLQLVGQGLSNREIGERLFLALDTVKGHNRHIFEKLNVKNRTQAVNEAIALGIVDNR